MPASSVNPFIALTRDGAARIAHAAIGAGELTLRYVNAANIYVVSSVEAERAVRIQVDIPPQYATLRWDNTLDEAQWMRKPFPDLHIQHLLLIRRPGAAIDFDAFRTMLPSVKDPGPSTGVLITHDPDLDEQIQAAGGSEFAGWLIQRDGVRPIQVAVEPEVLGIEQLRGRWPIDELATTSVMLVGCGSIGGAAADALAGYGIGHIELIDPDRFLWHNIVRHVLGAESVGQYKVDALKTRLGKRWPNLRVTARRLDVVDDAHHIRALINTVDIVLCTADGVAPRRVVSHLARRAGKLAVLAGVLDDGAIGEILRLRPTPRFGCLLCSRQQLADSGALDTEADQELDYGTGQVHQPMTAVPSDLHYIGILAAKTAVATMLESRYGDHTQRLPGEHAIIGLRPGNDLAAPFDLNYAGAIRWASIPSPRPACPTCSPPAT